MLQGPPAPVDTSVPQLMHRWLREHLRKGGKTVKAGIAEVCCETVSDRHGCNNKAGTGATATNVLTWKGKMVIIFLLTSLLARLLISKACFVKLAII